jgi:hypothetical protein
MLLRELPRRWLPLRLPVSGGNESVRVRPQLWL